MRILFVAPAYFNLQKPIEQELVRQGHSVTYINDVVIKKRTYATKNNYICELINLIKRIYYKVYDILFPNSIWREEIMNGKLNQSFDFLFVINGYTFQPTFIRHLRKYNSNISTCFYAWDTQRYYNYFRLLKYFDKKYTFDYIDASTSNIKFLPFYWCNKWKKNSNIKYVLSIVGSNHDGRYTIVRKIADTLDTKGLAYYFRVVEARDPNNKADQIVWDNLYRSYKEKGNRFGMDEIDIIYRRKKDSIITYDLIPQDEVYDIISQSQCLLDTDRESQTGTTPRIIWALAQKKKIISTNKNLIKMPFYNKDIISIIDRRNPVIDFDFINREIPDSFFPSVEYLRIDNWVKEIIS